MNSFLGNPGFHFFYVLIATPFWAYIMLKLIKYTENAWKSGKEVKKWIALCFIFLFLHLISGGAARLGL